MFLLKPKAWILERQRRALHGRNFSHRLSGKATGKKSLGLLTALILIPSTIVFVTRRSVRSGDHATPQRECNWKCYLDNYPDLTANGITEETAGGHYEAFGKGEGRDCRCGLLVGGTDWCTYANDAGRRVSVRPDMTAPATGRSRAASPALQRALRLDGPSRRPIWTPIVFEERDALAAAGPTSSRPTDHPHAAGDVAAALELVRREHGVPALDSDAVRVGVVTSISPWAEHVLRSAGARRTVSVDYAAPIACGVPWIEPRSFDAFASEGEGGTYDLLVSFGGVEHAGLAAHGGPPHPVGDVEAMAAMHRALRPGGVLLLGVPTADATSIDVVARRGHGSHRLYGPERLKRMLEGRFLFRARVWAGAVRGGWSDVSEEPALFPAAEDLEPGLDDWMNRHVLVLQKPQEGE